MVREFTEFLKQYGVIGLAIAVVIGGKLNALVSAVVDNLIMPLLAFVLPADAGWRTWAPGGFGLGMVLSALLEFLIVAWLVFLFAKRVLREEKVAKR